MSNLIAGTTDDPTIVYTPLELRGKTYQLLFNLAALAKAQKATGINFLKGIDFENLDADAYTALLHAGVGKMHPDVTAEQMADMVDTKNFSTTLRCLLLAFSANQMEAAKENPPTPPAAA